MTTVEFLASLKSSGIKIWIEDEQLRYRAPKGVMTSNLKQELMERKIEIITFIKQAKDAIGDKTLGNDVVPQKNVECEKPSQIELWPSLAEFFVYDDFLYYVLTNDQRRNDSYKVAINRLVKDKVVVDIGTGKDAILARFCAEANARKVYAIEMSEKFYNSAKACIEKLGLSDKITLILGDATKVNLPELADVCVSEIVGSIGGVEGAAVILNNARRLLKEDGVMIPSRSVNKIAGVSLPNEFLQNPHFTEIPAYYTRKIFEQVGYPFDLRLCLRHFSKSSIISTSSIFEDLNFAGIVEPEYSHKGNLTILKDSRLDGFVVWLNLHTIEGEVIDVLEHEYCWLPVYLPVFSPGIQVYEGDKIEIICSSWLCDNNLNPDYQIEGTVIKKTGEEIPFKYHSYHYKQLFKQTPFYEKVFSQYAVDSQISNSIVTAAH
ncbi:amino acid adenylation [Tolypothrix sp. NIES-4075]|uniref:TubC N-terminal docking domain-related protein n=1 Tax=Tolypothrix sp. NIES-4075 TaxID=2005459 RepID=UPI000B5C4092|nr:SAM-dependent methyltransferase [Tolypothrix sp. NIES-4075]GAX45462.1 amino acid adenylation [Tolypothrix sp. NIES-4075]